MYAAREGHIEAVRALIAGGARLNEVSADHSTALLVATINGNFGVAEFLLAKGADVTIASLDGATPLFGVVNIQWAPKTDTPQPTLKYEETHYLDLMKLVLESGADPNARTKKDLWYTRNREGTSSAGITPFWRCASVGDIDCMRLLIAYGADPDIANTDGITPLLIAAGAGFHGNNELTTPTGRLATVKYLVEKLQADVNRTDTAEGSARNDTMNTSRFAGGFAALHHAAARGDNAMILYLVSRGASVHVSAGNGTTVVDMANGPRQRIQPYPDTVALLEMLGSKNSHRCISC
jgi:ankyrin repeat protein